MLSSRMRPLAAAALSASVCAGLGAAGCSSEAVHPRSTQERKPLIEIVSWWLAPGEAEALQALIQTHGLQHPDARIFNSAAASSALTRKIVSERLLARDPPDLLQLNTRELNQLMTRSPGALEELDGTFEALGLRGKVFPEATADVTYDGHVVAMPVNFHRENGLFYNKAIFAAHGLAPPTTVPEFVTACRTLKAAGITPVATAHQGWILMMMLNALAAGTMGTDVFRDYFTGTSDAGEPKLREAIALFAEVLASYTNPDAGEPGFNWTNAALTIYNGDAAMFFHGDWARGYFTQIGWRPGVDFGVVVSPGASDLFLYLSDSFAIPRGAANERGARELIATVASPEGQVAFNTLKGSSPIRGDVNRTAFDPLGQTTLRDLETARVRMVAPNSPVYDEALVRFIKDRDAEALLRVFVTNRPASPQR